jgi:hypothetical protein
MNPALKNRLEGTKAQTDAQERAFLLHRLATRILAAKRAAEQKQ